MKGNYLVIISYDSTRIWCGLLMNQRLLPIIYVYPLNKSHYLINKLDIQEIFYIYVCIIDGNHLTLWMHCSDSSCRFTDILLTIYGRTAIRNGYKVVLLICMKNDGVKFL